MAQGDAVVWGIHAGIGGAADALFLQHQCIAVGWTKVGDLTQIRADREAFKAKVAECYPEAKPGAIPPWAGLLFRFAHEIKPSDIIVYPSNRDRQVHLGRITGPYQYTASHDATYPNRRSVQWVRALPRTEFTQGALYEIGSALTLFQVRNYAEEFVAALEGKPTLKTTSEDPTVALVADEIEQTTRDFVLKRLAQGLKGHPLEHFVAQLLGLMGYRTRVANEGADGGVDVVAHKDELGIEPPIIKVQVKSSEDRVGDPTVSVLYGKVANGEFGLLVTLGTFTNQAKSFAASKSNLRLIDGEELIGLVLRYYDQLDSRYKGLIPLKRVYVPEALEEVDTWGHDMSCPTATVI